jgi:hypothetical protein
MYSVDIFCKNFGKLIRVGSAGIYETELVGPYVVIDRLFNFKSDDVVVVIKAGAVYNNNILSKTLNQLSRIKHKSHCYFFIEDLFTDVDPGFAEIAFIEKIVQHFKLSYAVHHCEKNDFTKYFDWYVAESVINIKELPNITKDFSKKICCLNRRYTDYRYLASAFLSNYKQHCFTTQYYSLSSLENCRIDINKLDYRLNLITGIENLSKEQKLQNHTQMIDVDYTSESAKAELINLTQDCFCSLVTESKFHSTMPNFSEKTLRAIIAGRPFVLLAPVGTLKLLKDLGFKTFDKFWNEDYDSIIDATERFQTVIHVVKDIIENKELTLGPLMSILEHNQQHLKTLPENMYALRQSINNTV